MLSLCERNEDDGWLGADISKNILQLAYSMWVMKETATGAK